MFLLNDMCFYLLYLIDFTAKTILKHDRTIKKETLSRSLTGKVEARRGDIFIGGSVKQSASQAC